MLSTQKSIAEADDNFIGQTAWRAFLRLGFDRRGDKTLLRHREHYGPLRVQRPFYPEGDQVCHVYVLHPPGGVVGGDRLSINVHVNEHAHALITTPGAGKFYRALSQASVTQNLRLDNHGVLEWFPQESIVFDGANIQSTTCVELEAKSGFAGWEVFCFGRPASQEKFLHGQCRSGFEIWRNGQPLLVERGRINGGGELLNAVWGMQCFPVSGLFAVTGADANHLNLARESISSDMQKHVSATLLQDVLVVRYLGNTAEQARNYFEKIWKILRPKLFNKNYCRPRIWET